MKQRGGKVPDAVVDEHVGMESAIAKALLERAGTVFISEVRIGYGTCTKDG
jgi:hypothetical protein